MLRAPSITNEHKLNSDLFPRADSSTVKELASPSTVISGDGPLVAIGCCREVLFSFPISRARSKPSCGASFWAFPPTRKARAAEAARKLRSLWIWKRRSKEKTCFLVEDLVDSGATLSFLQRTLKARKPAKPQNLYSPPAPAEPARGGDSGYVGF